MSVLLSRDADVSACGGRGIGGRDCGTDGVDDAGDRRTYVER